MPKISVIIPCYNTEKYLPECLDSIIAQDLEDMEILCVDDGSTDGSADVIRSRQARDPRVRLISQENRGIAGARNTGLREACGEYIYFSDSDDRLGDITTLRRCCERMDDEQLDVLYGAASVFFDPPELEGQVLLNEREYFMIKHEYAGVFTGPELIARLRQNGDWCSPVPAKLFRREFLSAIGLFFIPGQVHEDEYFSFCALFLSDRIGVTREALYERRVRENSFMTAPVNYRRVLGNLNNMVEILRVMEAHRDTLGLDPDAGASIRSAKNHAALLFLELDEEERARFEEAITPDQLFYYTCFVKDEVALRRRLIKAQTDLSASKQSRDSYRDRLRKIEQSRSYRLLQVLLRPVRWLRRLFCPKASRIE